MIIIILIIIFTILLIKNYIIEKYNNDTFDTIFNDVIYYPNKYTNNNNNEFGYLINTGIYDCKKECKGKCIELGLTGRAYCFLN